jgi:hypothetical protein
MMGNIPPLGEASGQTARLRLRSIDLTADSATVSVASQITSADRRPHDRRHVKIVRCNRCISSKT